MRLPALTEPAGGGDVHGSQWNAPEGTLHDHVRIGAVLQQDLHDAGSGPISSPRASSSPPTAPPTSANRWSPSPCAPASAPADPSPTADAVPGRAMPSSS